MVGGTCGVVVVMGGVVSPLPLANCNHQRVTKLSLRHSFGLASECYSWSVIPAGLTERAIRYFHRRACPVCRRQKVALVVVLSSGVVGVTLGF